MSETKELKPNWLTLEEVEEFHETFEHPIGQVIGAVDEKVWKLRCKLILEELDELTHELGPAKEAVLEAALQEKLTEIRERKSKEQRNEHDLVGLDPISILKEAADLQYVVSGTYIALGVHPLITAVHTAVHKSNMSKLASIIEEVEISIIDNYARGKVDSVEAITTKSTDKGIIIYRKSDMKVLKAISYQDPNSDIAEIYSDFVSP